MAKVTSTFGVSLGNRGSRGATPQSIAASILEGSLTAERFESFWRELRTLQRKMEKAGNDEAKRLIPFIARQMMNIRSPRRSGGPTYRTITTAEMEAWADEIYAHAGTGRLPQGYLRWRALSPPWMRTKGFKPFFQGQTGELRTAVRGLRSWPISTLGGVTVTIQKGVRFDRKHVTETSRRFLMGALEVNIFPNARVENFPGLRSGEWDTVNARNVQLPGFSPRLQRKLTGEGVRGAGGRRFQPHRRPMIAPAAQFWALYRIPLALQMAARSPLSRLQRSWLS